MEIQGRIKHIGQSEFVGNNGFEKRDLVITTQEQYPQHISIQFSQGNCQLLDSLQIGQLVNITFNIQGREWTNPQGEIKYFNTLSGWKVRLVQITNVQAQNYSAQPQQQYTQPPVQTQQQAPIQGQMFNAYGQATEQSQEDFDDLPF